MPGYLMHVGAGANCPHGGQVTTVPTNAQVLVGGQPVATLGDTYPVAGCAFTVPPSKPQPCVEIQWLEPAARVLVGGQLAILQDSKGQCQSAEKSPQGPPIVVGTQARVRGI